MRVRRWTRQPAEAEAEGLGQGCPLAGSSPHGWGHYAGIATSFLHRPDVNDSINVNKSNNIHMNIH